MSMGNVRSDRIKRISHDLVNRYSDRFTTSFEENKKIVLSVAVIPSTKMRNRIAGYITRLMMPSEAEKSEESE